MLSHKSSKSIVRDYPWFIFIFGLVLGIALFSTINYFRLSGQNKNQPVEEDKTTNQPVSFNITANDHIWGNREAKGQLVVFSDFTCDYCREYFKNLEQFIGDYKDKLSVVWRHFPLNKSGEAMNAANAAECAGAQGKFWEMAKLVYEDQDNLSLNFYYAQAKTLKLDEKKFKQCLDGRQYQDKINSQYAEGIAKGIEGTPTSFLNGRLLLGALPYYDLSQLIEPLIQ